MNDEINNKINDDLINTLDTNKRIKNLENKMELILEKLEKLEKLENIEKNCLKMGNHINFVETVYETVRAPLQFISNKLTGNSDVLPLTDDVNKSDINIKY